MRNWTNLDAFGISRFLYYYRLVGVVAFELTQIRALLLVFPNTFEYFFDAYEAVRIRWDPRRMSRRLADRHRGVHLDLHQAAPGVVDPRRPARRDGPHQGEASSASRPTASWAEAFAANPDRARGRRRRAGRRRGRGLVGHHPRPAARRPRADVQRRRQPAEGRQRQDRPRPQAPAPRTSVDRELLEKIILVSLVGVIFGRMLPGSRRARSPSPSASRSSSSSTPRSATGSSGVPGGWATTPRRGSSSARSRSTSRSWPSAS